MAPAQAAFQSSIGEDIGLGDHSRQSQGIFQRKRVQCRPKADFASPLRGRGEHGQRVGGNRKFLKKVMINDRVNVEAHGIGMLDLPKDFPGHLVMGFSRRGLHLGVDPESHQRFLSQLQRFAFPGLIEEQRSAGRAPLP